MHCFHCRRPGPHQTEANKSTAQHTQAKPETPAAVATQEKQQKAEAVDRSTSEDQLAAYLEELLNKDFPLPNHYKMHLEVEARIKTALSQKIEIDFDKKPLTEVVQFFREELDVNIQFDEKVFEEDEIDTSEPVTAHAADITARSALEFVLRNLEESLTWTVQQEMLLITTLDEADVIMQTKFYDVTDLVITRAENGELILDYEQLKDAILSGCHLDTFWLEVDGDGGTIESFDAVGIHGLAIQQTRQIHDEIEVILAGLRRLRRKEPAFLRKIKRILIESQPSGVVGGGGVSGGHSH